MRRLLVISIAVLTLVAVCLLFIAKGKGTDKSVVFPNGVEVRVRGAFQGGKSVSSDPPWPVSQRGAHLSNRF